MRYPNRYRKGYTIAERKEAARKAHRKDRENKTRAKTVIVWDGEGMKLSGQEKPQHYVLFGCSVRPDNPLVIDKPTERLTFEQIADYCIEVAEAYPNAIHLGYFFRYDQNMIIWSLPWPAKHAIYDRNGCRVRRNGKLYTVKCIFGKTLRITRVANDKKVSILIEDIAAFFGTSFVKAYESLFPTPADPDNWAVVVEGKKLRADTMFEDMPDVLRYWRAEILALRELAEEFRRLMFDGGFMLTEWYGPGALANYIRRRHGLVEHEWGGKEGNMPPELHEAVKGAFYGGHIEQYKVGVIKGPIFQYDINSAYPSAFRHIPSLSEGGQWRHVGALNTREWWERKDLRLGFTVLRVRWKGKSSNPVFQFMNTKIQPLPHRSQKGMISYPHRVEGWYWAPEVGTAMGYARHNKDVECEILDCWHWEPKEPVTFPWEELMEGLYAARCKLKAEGNPVQMGYKLSMNSLYGKMAQRAGGKDKAPSSHTLPIAGYVTSWCRSQVMKLMLACPSGTIISVETDGVFTTESPEQLGRHFRFSDKLGEWGVKEYDDMVSVQNGVYLLRKGGEWEPPKSRGIPASAMDIDAILAHFDQCTGDRWPKLEFQNKEAFIGLGAAISRATRINVRGRRSTNPFKARALHCTWKVDPREVDLEGHSSKRAHYAATCRQCVKGIPLTEQPHDMVIHSEADRKDSGPEDWASSSYTLPWEKNEEEEKWRLEAEKDGMFNVDGEIR
jgi:hypothetical protein